MITAGVDLSSQAVKTAACVIDWSDQRATVVELTLGVDDDSISALIARVDKLGIDVPLGWPIAFAEAVVGYSVDGSWPTEYRHTDNASYCYRRTDLWVWKDLGMSPPLSVSADRISLPAMRAAALLSHVPRHTARDGSGVVVEVYPAAALRRWVFTRVSTSARRTWTQGASWWLAFWRRRRGFPSIAAVWISALTVMMRSMLWSQPWSLEPPRWNWSSQSRTKISRVPFAKDGLPYRLMGH